MHSEYIVNTVMEISLQNTDCVGRGRACESACHAVMIEVIGMSIFVRISLNYMLRSSFPLSANGISPAMGLLADSREI